MTRIFISQLFMSLCIDGGNRFSRSSAYGVFSRQVASFPVNLTQRFAPCSVSSPLSLSPDSQAIPSFLQPCFAPWLMLLQPKEFALGSRIFSCTLLNSCHGMSDVSESIASFRRCIQDRL